MYVDEVEVDEEGIAEVLMDDTAIAQVASKCIILIVAVYLKIVKGLLHKEISHKTRHKTVTN